MPFSTDDPNAQELLARNASFDLPQGAPNPLGVGPQQTMADAPKFQDPTIPFFQPGQAAQPGGIRKVLATMFAGMADAAMKESTGMNSVERQQAQLDIQQKRQQLQFGPMEMQAKLNAMSAQPRFDPASGQFVGVMNDAQYQQYVRGQGAAKINAGSREKIASDAAAAKPGHTITAGGQVLQWNPGSKRYDISVGSAQSSKMGSVSPEIYAQLGAPPLNDPEKLKAWGQAAEAIKNRMASASGAARAQAFNAYRPVQVINPQTGDLEYQYAQDAIGSGASPAGAGMTAGSRQAQFSEIKTASQSLRSAIQNLDRDFTPDQRAKLTYAMSLPSEGLVHNMASAMLGTEQLTEKQKDFVIWATQMQERALSLRNIAGMGQGAEDLRQAIRATLPGIRSADKGYALKQLDAFDQQVNSLRPGIPNVKGLGGHTSSTAPPPGAKVRDFSHLVK